MSTVLSLRGVRKLFPLKRAMLSSHAVGSVHAVDGVDLDLYDNETLALVGESGSGKTTLGHLLLALENPSAGTITWHGRPLAKLNADEHFKFRREVQVVFQDPFGSLNPRMTVRQIIGRPLRLHAIVPPSEIDDEVERLLDLVRLRPARAYIDRFPHEFSGGQRQRIAIARAIALRPRVLIADEPVSALDVSVRAQILQLLSELQHQLRIAMLFTTHDLGVVRFIADRVAVMYLGKIVEVAPKDVFFREPRHPYSRMLLGSALSPNPHQGLRRRVIEVQGEPPSPINPPSGCRFHTRCPYVFDRCASKEPLLRSTGPQHFSACHLDADQDCAWQEPGCTPGEQGRNET